MVRLGAKRNYICKHFRKFQFQYGAIGSCMRPPHLAGRLGGFNSSMVRLGVKPATPAITSIRLFQFQYGAIGRFDETRSLRNFCRFNSSMVRLGVFYLCPWILFCEVSIPVWCDWEEILCHFWNLLIRFQFQYGAIGSNTSHPRSLNQFRFNSSMVRLGEGNYADVITNLTEFQFQYGAIGSKHKHLF